MFKPFEDDQSSSAIYDLTLENQLDCVNLYGNLQISKDQKGLETAKALQAWVNAVVDALEQDKNLPEKVALKQEKEVENPFL
ncbi:hypothetical protein [Acinetobacter sp. MD2(2019)]|uniref:hypothetical protein n=1 Tax=Acinetobacter sp. MD2(2019) TaxID=2605273 RepID=UPI002D1EB23A|nr:hypothetical protein [Acinetobacter sp. MD2(2019)]MEB3753173.1 hypothetical protein [Acinetobacter sp. MD2(2019)]